MSKRKYTAGIIGTGRIGFTLGFDHKREQPASHTMALNKNRRVKLLYGSDKDETRLAYWKRFNRKAAVFSNYSHMFAASCPDIVVIAVNEESHLEASIAAIHSRPKLIILEKPVALSVAQAEKIKEEADEYQVPILVNHERRFSEDYKLAKEYLSKIGKIITVNARLDSSLYVYNPSKEDTGEYSLWHDGTHLIDCVMYMLENFNGEENVLYNQKITSIVYDKDNPRIVRNLSVHYESEKCADVNIHLSGKSRWFGFELDIIGSEGRVKIGNGIFEFSKREESKLYSGFYSLASDKKVHRPEKTKYFSNMVQNAVDFLDGKEPLRSSINTGINTLKILENLKKEL